MASKTQIANVALLRLGVTKPIANVDTENSVEARAARLLFDDERDFVLRDFPWPFATKYAVLGLVEGSSAAWVNYDWMFSYRYPSDCLNVRRIVTAQGRLETIPPPFRVGRDNRGKLVYTSEENAQIEYTQQITDAAEFDPVAVSCLAWRLAASMAPALSRLATMTQSALQMYDFERSVAEANALNEGQLHKSQESEFIRARD